MHTCLLSFQKPIIIYLRELSLFGEEHLARSIPESVLSQHYVALRIALRRCAYGAVQMKTHTLLWQLFAYPSMQASVPSAEFDICQES